MRQRTVALLAIRLNRNECVLSPLAISFPHSTLPPIFHNKLKCSPARLPRSSNPFLSLCILLLRYAGPCPPASLHINITLHVSGQAVVCC